MNGMFDLTGKVAVVTGGNGGIGFGMARGLARAGARVVIAARDAAKSAQAVDALRAIGSDAFAVSADVSNEDSVAALFAEVASRCGRLDILVNNAGTFLRKPPQDTQLAEWQAVMDTNSTGPFLCARAAYPHLCAAGGGKIINVASLVSLFGVAHAAAYSASKGAVLQLTRSLATAWAADRIQVNAVLPGWIDTPMTHDARVPGGELNDRVIARTPAGRWGEIVDFEGVAVFLASTAADFITGTAIAVDGGYSVQI
ncbi:MAG: glucose 1-dehydrogenase [Betaproteobacteria bacterium]|nr:glucose 1-dehydrogenase [Betaproteobacteria bacterium]